MTTVSDETLLQRFREEAGAEFDDSQGLDCSVEIENIGGIEECRVAFEPGITLLQGSNATNRTSFLRAVNGSLGGTMATLKSDAEHGEVTFTVGNTVVASRTYSRTERGTANEGSGLYDDATTVDTFVTLIEGNPIREAVKSGSGERIREVLMRPVDIDDIQAQIRTLTERRDEIDSNLRQIERELEKIPQVTEKREALQEEIDDLETRIQQTRDEIASREDRTKLDENTEAALEELESKREELAALENERKVTRAELEGVKEDRERLRAELDTLTEELASSGVNTAEVTYENLAEDDLSVDDLDSGDDTDIDERISRLRGERDRLKQTINELTRVRQFNGSLVDGDTEVLEHFVDDDLTAELNPDDREMICPTCSSVVTTAAIQEQNAEIATLIEEKRTELTELESQLTDLESRRSGVEKLQNQVESYASRASSLDRELSELEATLEELDETIQETEVEVREREEALDEAMNEYEAKADAEEREIVELTEQLNSLEFERGRKEQELESVTRRREELEAKGERKDELERDREEAHEEIVNLRDRIETVESSIITTFNSHMETVLEIVEAENIARVWIERKKPDVSETTIRLSEFELHIVRESDSGVYEDTIETLSESEREIIGLTAALAGYLTHDLDETIPFILLDSIEAIDGQRLADLIEYFSDYSLFLFVAILPRYEGAFSEEYATIQAEEQFI